MNDLNSLSLNIEDFQKVFSFAEILLRKNEDLLNDLNVFPVPDGDTGTNILGTLQSINESLRKENPTNFPQFTKIVIQAALIGAHGNSGVIFSQFLIGFLQSLSSHSKITPDILVQACLKAQQVSYSSVGNPQEGTILTVIKRTTDEFDYQIKRGLSIEKSFEKSFAAAKKALLETPDFLPQLKKSGVVDAGGAAFVFFLEAFKQAFLLKKEPFDADELISDLKAEIFLPNFKSLTKKPQHGLRKILFQIRLHFSYQLFNKSIIFFSRKLLGLRRLIWTLDIDRFRHLSSLFKKNNSQYCLEILLSHSQIPETEIQKNLESLGESLVIAEGKNLKKIHLHTNKISDVVNYLKQIGNIEDQKISSLEKKETQPKNSYQENISSVPKIITPRKPLDKQPVLNSKTTQRKTTIITESLSSLNFKLARENQISLIEAYLIKNGQTYREGEIDLLKYYQEMKQTGKAQKTAHANYHDLKSAFAKEYRKGNRILYIAACRKLTGTYDLACAIAKEYPSWQITPYDSQAMIGMQGLICLKATNLTKQGKNPTEITEILNHEREQFGILGNIADLKFLAQSGRIGKAKALLGNFFSIKPIIGLKKGEIVPFDKARTQTQAVDKVFNFLKQKQRKLQKKKAWFGLDYTDNLPWVKTLEPKLRKAFTVEKIYYFPLPPTIGNHLGPGSWGVSYYFYD